MEYCLMRIGGSMARYSPSDREAVGYFSMISRGERRLLATSTSKAEPARASTSLRRSGSGRVAAILRMFWGQN